MDPSPELRAAFHAAGHGVSARALSLAVPRWITILPSEDAVGACRQSSDRMGWSKLDAPVLGREWVGRRAICFLSGHAAEERLTGSEMITVESLLALPRLAQASREAQPTWDLNAADRVLRGFEPLERERGRWLTALWDRACRLMEQEWTAVQGIAAALLTHGTLDADAVVELLSDVIPLPLSEAFAWSKSAVSGPRPP